MMCLNLIQRNFGLQYKDNKPYLFELQKYNELNKLINYANGLYQFFDKQVLQRFKNKDFLLKDFKNTIKNQRARIQELIKEFNKYKNEFISNYGLSKHINGNIIEDNNIVNYGAIGIFANSEEKVLLHQIINNVKMIKDILKYNNDNIGLLVKYTLEVCENARYLVDNVDKKFENIIKNKLQLLYQQEGKKNRTIKKYSKKK